MKTKAKVEQLLKTFEERIDKPVYEDKLKDASLDPMRVYAKNCLIITVREVFGNE